MPTPRFNGQPTQAADIQSLCRQYVGVEPALIEQYDRFQVRMQDRIQSRIDKNNAPDFMVKRYAHQMAESRFPAPLFTADNITVDGNTRVKAHELRNTRYIEAWVLPVAWEDADPATKRKLLLLSLALNAMNGLPLDENERIGYASELIKDGISDEEIRGKTGLEMSKITSLRAQQRAKERLTHLGVDAENLKFADPVLRAFGKPNAMQLDDANYVGLVQLTKDAQIKAGEINSLAVSLNETTSTEARGDRLARERQARQPQILAIAHGQQQRNLADRLRKTLEMLIEKPVTAFVEGNSEKTAEYVELLDKALDKLAEVRDLQLSRRATAATQPASHAQPVAPVQ
jgi:hypothetical protein